MNKFINNKVVITDSGSGIGRAFAIAFGKLGATVALNDLADK